MAFIFHYPAVMMFPFFLLYLTICPELSPTVLPTFGHPLNPCIILYSVPFSTIVLPFSSPYNITWFSLQHHLLGLRTVKVQPQSVSYFSFCSCSFLISLHPFLPRSHNYSHTGSSFFLIIIVCQICSF